MSDDHKTEHVPEGVIERLPLYLGVLLQLRADGEYTVASSRLGDLTDINPAQIRRDLSYFGTFGKRGVGYEVVALIGRIQRILGSDHTHRIVLVGAGNLGSAIARYDGLRSHGFMVAGIFDNDGRKHGARIGDLIVRDVAEMPDFVRAQGVEIGVIAVPPENAQGVADMMAGIGVRVILNYTPQMLRVPEDVTLHNADPVRELLNTLYHLEHTQSMAPRSGEMLT